MTNEAKAHQEPTCLPAGRYEFKDAGIYIGEWLNEKAVGLGLITKDKSQGEYTGLWDNGSEKSGVFLWPNAPGAMYEGEWGKNRRNGFGIFTREDWVIMGKFADDFIILGVKGKEGSIGRFEGDFENGLPSFGVETYADRGTYAGEYKSGIREGMGVRTSIPFGDIINFFPEEAALAAEMSLQLKQQQKNNQASGMHAFALSHRSSLYSLRSIDVGDLNEIGPRGLDEDNQDEDEPHSSGKPLTKPLDKGIRNLPMSCKFKCGFVLSSQRSELVLKQQCKLKCGDKWRSRAGIQHHGHQKRTRSLTTLFSRSVSRESVSVKKRRGSMSGHLPFGEETPKSVFNLDQEDAIDPETIEIYSGQWEADARNGYGVCERSDGVFYEGQWLKNQRHGYGRTHFPDGTSEQGRYQYGKLVFLSWSKGTKPHLLLQNYHIMREVASAVKRAQIIAEQARMRANEAVENLDKVMYTVTQSKQAAESARDYSLETRALVKEMYPDFEQPGLKYLEDMVRLMKVTRRGNESFEAALEAAQLAVSGEVEGPSQNVTINVPDNGGDGSPKVSKHGKPISRAGSYRIRRQQSIRQAAAVAKAKARESKSPNSRLDVPDNLFSSSSESDQLKPSPNEMVTLLVPQLPTYSPIDQESPVENSSSQHTSSDRPFGETGVHTTQHPNQNMVNSEHLDSVSDGKSQTTSQSYSTNSSDLSTSDRSQSDSELIEDEKDRGMSTADEHKGSTDRSSSFDMSDQESLDMASRYSDHDPIDTQNEGLDTIGLYHKGEVVRTPSVCTTYVEIPQINELSPTSPIPNIPLSRLITNREIMGDYFDHYTRTSPDHDCRTLRPTVDSTSDVQHFATININHPDRVTAPINFLQNSSSESSSDPRKSVESNRGEASGLARRRTLPTFLTQKPQPRPPRTEMKTSLAAVAEDNKFSPGPVPSKTNGYIHSSHTLPPGQNLGLRRTVSRSSVISGQSFNDLMAEEDQDCGIPASIDQSANSDCIYLVEDDGARKCLQIQLPVSSVPFSRTKNQMDESEDHSPTRRSGPVVGPKDLTLVLKTDKTPISVVSNVLLDQLQDELPELTSNIRERCLESTGIPSRYSVPDISQGDDSGTRNARPHGLSPDELYELSRIVKHEREIDLARRQEGEIVIQLLDLFVSHIYAYQLHFLVRWFGFYCFIFRIHMRLLLNAWKYILTSP